MLILILCLFGCCSCFVLPLLDPSFQNLIFNFKLLFLGYGSSHTISYHVAILHTLSLLLHCRSSRIATPFMLSFLMHCHSSRIVALLTLLFSRSSSRATIVRCSFHIVIFLSCYNCALFFSHYNPSHVAIPFALLFSPCYSSHAVVPLTLFFSHHCAFQVFVNPTFVVFPMLSLLFLSHSYYRTGKGIHPQAPRIINFESFEVSLRQFRI